ncbi:MAG: RelA/SpoT family protein, partial [Oscillospiraceae bacterium]
MTFDDLKQQMKNSGRQYDMDMIERAYSLAESSHAGQNRRSGEPYITHPIYVASLLVEMGLDTESLCAALLHDVVEDTGVPLSEIKSKFGEDIALLVDGVTKLGQIPFSSVEEQQAENIRKMLLAMSKDIRVMIIKLCDRLHNMRTLDAMSEEKQRTKSLETMEVYAPIAHRLGMSAIKEELEDLALKYLDPVGYAEISELLRKNDADGSFIEKITQNIRDRLIQNGIMDALIESRVKSVYSTYRKLFVQNKSIEEIYDIYAVRVILQTVNECYNALGILHDMYRPIPNRFKDYISTPKPNMYQSLHTTVIGKDAIPFEIQIRTVDMHYTAEYGIAAHWKYKVGINGKDKLEERLAWVRQLLESQKESEDAVDILRNIKSDLLPEEVFVFTPKGDVINLPVGATVIDFAYAIHSAVGNRMTGAKVNGRIVPLSYVVKTGEIVEVLT